MLSNIILFPFSHSPLHIVGYNLVTPSKLAKDYGIVSVIYSSLNKQEKTERDYSHY